MSTETAESPGKDANAYFVGGRYIYEKTFPTLPEWKNKHMEIAFGGVYRNTRVYLNEKELCFRPYGYVPFQAVLEWTSANLSERALREIYLKGFGIAVKEGGCRALMSSYNRINGVWSGVNRDTLTTFLREECGFEGIVVTDWDSSHEGLEAENSIAAGITMLMAGDGNQRKAIRRAIKEGRLDEKLARDRAIKNAAMILSGGSI